MAIAVMFFKALLEVLADVFLKVVTAPDKVIQDPKPVLATNNDSTDSARNDALLGSYGGLYPGK